MAADSNPRGSSPPGTGRTAGRILGPSADVLREHARAWLEESRCLEEVEGELNRLEGEVRERMKRAMGRASAVSPDPNRLPPVAQRCRDMLLQLRNQVARRDVLQTRQDLAAVSKARTEFDRMRRQVEIRRQHLESLLGESVVDSTAEEPVQQTG